MTDRRNVVVIADEAHRSQYGFKAKVDKKTGEITYGFSKYLRDALPNASFIGFTGTPIEKDDVNTPAVFGEAVAKMLNRFGIVKDMFHGFDYDAGLSRTPKERLAVMAAALDWILAKQHEAAEREKKSEDRKKAHRRYQDAVLALSKAFSLASASDEAREIRDEVGFFQTIRAALAKASQAEGGSTANKKLAVQQIIDRSVVSTEIVDILSAAGLKSPDI